MSATGLDVLDKSLQSTHAWLDQISAMIGPDRHLAWHVLGAVLRAVRDRLPLELAVHLGAQLPIIVRGLYYDQWRPAEQPLKMRSREEFLAHVSEGLANIRPVNVAKAVHAVFGVLDHFVDPGQVRKVRDSLPQDIRELWPVIGRSEDRGAQSLLKARPPVPRCWLFGPQAVGGHMREHRTTPETQEESNADQSR